MQPEQPRRMQVRDVTMPIEAVCRQFLDERGIPALYLHELTRPLLDEIHALMDRHGAEVREDGITEGRAQGRRLAITAVRSQAALPDLMHFDRPSDFRKGVLSCLAALEALEGKPDA